MSQKNRNHDGYDDGYVYQTNKKGKRVKSAASSNFEDVSSYSTHSGKKGAGKKKSKGQRVIKVLLAIVFSLLIVLGAGLIYVSTYLLGDLNTTNLTKDPAKLGIPSNIVTDSNVKNIALFGVDSRGGDFTGRSDATLILSVDMRHRKIKVISLLRDSYVYINGTQDKLTHAYGYGGYELAIKTLNQNFNLDIMDYATVNFGSLANIIDGVGGIDLNITDGEVSEINKNLRGLAKEQPELGISEADNITQSGDVHLNGSQAVAYGRIRKLDSDFGRANRQQNVLESMFKKVMSVNKLELPGMVKELAKYCETNMEIFEDIIPLGQVVLSGFTMERMTIPGETPFGTLPWDDPWSRGELDMSVISYDLEMATKMIDAFIKEEESPYWEELHANSAVVE